MYIVAKKNTNVIIYAIIGWSVMLEANSPNDTYAIVNNINPNSVVPRVDMSGSSVVDLAKQYSKYKDNIKFETVSVTERPDLAEKYGAKYAKITTAINKIVKLVFLKTLLFIISITFFNFNIIPFLNL